jgi:sigma-E factor negative regulatory protein RseB
LLACLLLLVTLTVLAASPLRAESDQSGKSRDLIDMLTRMSDADSSHFYRGTFILVKPGELSALQVTHGRDDNGSWESLESLTGESRTVIRQDSRVISVYPERELVTIRNTDDHDSLHFSLPDDVTAISDYYSLHQREDDRIANRAALVVDLVPDDEYRYGYRYWLDKQTGLLLRCDLVDENQAVVEQMMFTSLEYLPQSPAIDFSLDAYEHFHTRHITGVSGAGEAKEVPETAMWQLSKLPAGFKRTESAMRYSRAASEQSSAEQLSAEQVDTGKPDLLHMVYSDGLASVSVFIEDFLGGTDHLMGPASMGAVNAYGNPLGRHYITVVGEVPPRTVKLLAESIVLKDR